MINIQAFYDIQQIERKYQHASYIKKESLIEFLRLACKEFNVNLIFQSFSLNYRESIGLPRGGVHDLRLGRERRGRLGQLL